MKGCITRYWITRIRTTNTWLFNPLKKKAKLTEIDSRIENIHAYPILLSINSNTIVSVDTIPIIDSLKIYKNIFKMETKVKESNVV